MPAPHRITRLAPSPTGALHLGNARTFLVTFLLARTRRWRILLRVEDLDGPRVKAGAAAGAVEDLRWLGLDWDERVPDQSQRAEVYARAVRTLQAAGRAYPCICSRTDVERAASAPHPEDGIVLYGGACRGRWADEEEARRVAGRPPAVRMAVGDAAIAFDDRIAGPQRFDLAATCGDFVIRKADGVAAYQLAVVLDDHAAGVTDVVRGDDLLDSTPRQLLLQQALGLSPPPTYWHLPLVIGPDGRRLAKRHGDTRLAHYRARGVTPERLLGLLAFWSGQLDRRRPVSLVDLLAGFDIGRLPTQPVVFGREDEAYLNGG
ncbi:MAG: tRNA glutamyl-Q(34) synthetase GluQRS [Planctomycetes bacterium]|nr:tRNA glutamyl-Q(34) synthetase GluQRS [Planctomycetota bacterium]